MRFLLVAFLAVAAASRGYLDQETSYRPGKDYTYFYTSQILSGVSVDSVQYAGLKFKGNVKFTPMGNGEQVKVQFEPLRIMRLNREIGHYHPTDSIPDSEWVPVEGGEQQKINNELQKWCSFEFANGKLINFKTQPSDPDWSANVKRGMLSFFQLNLNQNSEQSERDPDQLRIRDKLNLVTPQTEQQPRKYLNKVMEEDIMGNCESVYHMSPEREQSRSEALTLHVTKIRNTDKCTFRPRWETGIMENVLFDNRLYREQDVLRWQIDGDYIVQGRPDQYIMKHGRQVSKQHFGRIEVNEGEIITYTVQEMRLVAVEKARDIPRDTSGLQRKRLQMEMPEQSFSERQQQEISTAQERAKVSLLEELLTEAEQMTHPHVLPNATKPFAKINILLRKISRESVQSLVQKYCNRQPLSNKGQILVDSLSTCTRSDTVPFITELVRQNIISDLRGGYMMNMIAQRATSSPRLAADLIHLVGQSGTLPAQAIQTRRSALLALGSVGFKLKEKAIKFRDTQLEQIVTRIAQELIQLLQNCRSTEEKLVVLKAIGNSGLVECMNACKDVIRRTSEPVTVREKALYALRRMAPLAWQEVQNVCLDVYKNNHNPEKLRIAAFIITMKTNPSKPIIRMLAKTLNREPSLQVGSFVYSYLKTRCDWQNDIFKNRTQAIKEALNFVRPVRPGYTFSKDLKWEIYSKSMKSSFMPELAYIMSRDAALPQSLIFRGDLDLFGFPFFGHEIGIDMEGLQTVMKNLVGPKSVIEDLIQGRLSLKDILEPIQRQSPEMLSHIRTMMDKITISERDLRNFVATLYVKYHGVETQYFTLDSQSMQSVIEFAMENSVGLLRELEQGWNTKTVRSIPLLENSFCVPTPSGLPLYMNMTWNLIFVLDSSARVENLPSMRDLMSVMMPFGSSRFDDRSGEYRRDRNWRRSSGQETKLDLHLKPTFTVDSELAVGVELANLRTLVVGESKYYMQYPFTSEIKVDLETGKLKTKLRLPQRAEEIYQQVQNTRTCFIRNPDTPESPRFYVEEKVIAFQPSADLLRTHNRYRIPYANLDLEVYTEEDVFNARTVSPLIRYLYQRFNYTVYLQPTSDMAREISMKSVYLGPDRVDRAQELVRDVLDIDSDESTDSEDRDSRERRSSEDEGDSWWWSWGSNQRSSYGRSRSSSSQYPFEPVRAKSSVSSSNKYKLITSIKTHGSRSPKKMHIQLTHLCSDDKKKHQDDIQVVYDPVYESSSQQKKIVLSTFTDADVLKKHLIEGHSSYSDSKELACKAELFYGPKDYTQKYIDAEVKIGRGAPLHIPRVHTSRTYSQQQTRIAPIEVSLDLDYQSMPRQVVHYCKKVDLMMKLLPYVTDKVTVETEEARNPPNKVKLIAEFKTEESEIELMVKKPSEDELIKGIPIPFLPKRDDVCSRSGRGCNYNKWAGRDYDLYHSSGSRPIDSFIHYISSGRVPGKCEVLGQQIHTFDKETIHFPKTDCEVILAKDCSSSVSPSFMITVKEKNKEENKKIVHIYDPRHKIKVEPKDGWFESGIQVEVDDRKVSLPDEGQKITIRSNPSDPRSEKVCDIKKKHGKIEIYSYASQIKVKTDGVDIEVEAHSSYFGQLCGACSNYNSEPMDDLMGPMKEMYSRPEEFLLSYVIPSSRCNIDEVRAQLTSRIPRLFAARDSSKCQKIPKYHYETRQKDGESQACFSVRPVPTCVGDCAYKTGKDRTTSVGFFCMRATDSKVPTLLNKLKEGQELAEVKGKKPHFTKDIKVADICRARSSNEVREQRDKQQEEVQYIQEA